MQVPELIGGASGLGWVAAKAVLLFAVAVIGLRLGERRTLAQLSAFDFAVAVAIGAIIGRGATSSDTSFATSAIALVTFLVAHRVVAIGRRHSQVVRLIDYPPRVLVARGELQGKELARAGLTAADVYALLREKGVSDLGQVGYLLYETRGAVTVISAGREPSPLVRDGLNASGYRDTPGTAGTGVTKSRRSVVEPGLCDRLASGVPIPATARHKTRGSGPGYHGRDARSPGATLRPEPINQLPQGCLMPMVTVGRENSADIEIHYEDHGAGQPVVLIHGYPLSGRAWDKQVPALLEAGHRVITYDRRGFGQSSQPTTGYDYDTFAADLAAVADHLDLRDAVLVGHSMGTGEVTRYLAGYGSDRVAKGVLVSPIPPFLLQTPDNPDGVPQALFDGFAQAAMADAPAWMKGFLDNFYNADTLRGTLVSDQAWQASWNLAVTASATAAVACIGTWATDFRTDLPKIDVPMLVVQGDADRVLPIDKTGQRLPGLINDVRLIVVEGGPHAIPWTHAAQVNTALLDFLRS